MTDMDCFDIEGKVGAQAQDVIATPERRAGILGNPLTGRSLSVRIRGAFPRPDPAGKPFPPIDRSFLDGKCRDSHVCIRIRFRTRIPISTRAIGAPMVQAPAAPGVPHLVGLLSDTRCVCFCGLVRGAVEARSVTQYTGAKRRPCVFRASRSGWPHLVYYVYFDCVYHVSYDFRGDEQRAFFD